ncbi:Benzoyl-CoA reductase/2-hydroxyglutaryl-CoA dehydratase subunit, BcrC/BadD/HgdB [Desulfotomaculum arcticum]|uniref:Benzoyl-CoA reductase/2-hydroxyglutaryl-CoA dehydratase subunit, BcrC/BadD/HgdB n=1 Tax=Desulfotruncus arcticus DSM 17038 TaxID=1121424 RepID=A0A1I2N966_9FIRM|nr:2-hydroxyacyl-CoA dehydratase [Desulfotruncus arcticus]SFF99419.1 Benzoyl-CoA reductase/2-hydroxyglutaryl-CoA dehydratase subunit, BcrC/BadD/HgdB [Desulfotomaculum arcticum] [Desulfotruncus arcticus DSM 17038]
MKIGITTTVPMEIIFAAGHTPVDLNNVFITGDNPGYLVEEAELAGYPRNVCSWIKGLYSTVLKSKDIRTVIAVTQGDCSNTHALMETLELAGIEIIAFAFPFDRDPDLLRLQMEKLMEHLGTDYETVYATKTKLDQIRQLVWQIDQLTWRENVVHGWENHLFQVNCSDFMGDPDTFAREADEFIAEAKTREPDRKSLRIGYIGVPPIMGDLYDYLESKGGRVVFNETQRQFSMPYHTKDMVEQYRLYTYPYGIFFRLNDICNEISRRKIDGIIHYAQSFCYRQIEDLIIRQKIKMPVLTIEGDKPNQLDARTKMRIDSFLEMLR